MCQEGTITAVKFFVFALNMSALKVKQKWQAALKQRGGGMLSLVNSFKEFDKDGDGFLSWEEFCSAVKIGGLNPSPQDTRVLFVDLDKDGDHRVSYNEFIEALRGPLSSKRRELITQVFRGIDSNNDGIISMTDIGACFNPKNHPDVKAGRTTVPVVLKEFFESLGMVSEKGILTLGQFIEYYSNISAFDDDVSFEDSINSLWNVSKVRSYPQVASLQQLAASSNVMRTQTNQLSSLLDTLRQQLKLRGARGIVGIQRKFRIIDDDGDKRLSYNEFKKALRECSIEVSDIEMAQLFGFFDKNKDGSIDFDEFIVGLRVRLFVL